MKKLLSLFLVLTFILSFSIPVSTKAAGTPGQTYYQVDKNDSRFEFMPDGTTRTNIDDADVAVVKQGGLLIVWTMNPLTSVQERAIYDAISSQKNLGIGGTSWSSTYFFSGMSYSQTNPYSGPNNNVPKNFGEYWASYVNGHYYLYANSADKISHYILGSGIFQGVTPVIEAYKQIVNNPGGTLPTFHFTLKDGQTTVGTASINQQGGFTFSNLSFTMPTGQHTLTLTMTEDQTSPTANWTYSTASYQVVVRSDGSVTYQNSSGTGITGLPMFTNTYTPPVTPPTPTLSVIGGHKAISGNPTGTIPTFNFTLKNGQTTVGTASINKDGDFTFNIPQGAVTLPPTGSTLTLTMAEDQTNPAANWTYSTASYQVVIHSDGSVTYQNNDGTPSGLPVFTNTYTPPVTPPTPTLAVIGGHKAISGNPTGTTPTFGFTLKNGQTTVGTASINKDGDFTFNILQGAITLPPTGSTLTLTMTEDPAATVEPGWTYSTASYQVVVYSDGSVTYQNSDGSSIATDLPVFTNTYTPPVTPPTPTLAVIGGHKAISGNPTGTIPTFGFTLKNGQTTVGTASINKDGDFTFNIPQGAVTLPAEGSILTLTMTEDPAATVEAGWTYSTATYRVAVHSDGSVTYQNSDGSSITTDLPVFTNTYATTDIPPNNPPLGPAPELNPIQVHKSISGNPTGDLPTFGFTLKNGQTTVGTASVNHAGTVTFTMQNFNLPEGESTVTLTMTEDQPATVPAGWTYSSVSYQVVVHSDGSITYLNSDGSAVNGIPDFTNIYDPSQATVIITDTTVPLADNPQTNDTGSPLAEIITAFVSLGIGTLLIFRRKLTIHLRKH